jgi:hypothetical protein
MTDPRHSHILRPTDPIAAQQDYDPQTDPDYLRLSHALDTPWTLQKQTQRSGLTKAIVYAGDPHKATVVLICEHARQMTVDCLTYVVAMHNARVAAEGGDLPPSPPSSGAGILPASSGSDLSAPAEGGAP